ncbi:10010_t:CDS:2, partial [Diversispora eburnea]
PKALNPSVPEISNPLETVDSPEMPSPSVPSSPETVDSLHKYETSPGQAQKFLADDSAVEFDDEMGFNMIFFYENLDKGTFDEHKDDWVLIYKQEIIKYDPECMKNELADLEEEMPGSIYFPVDQRRHEDLVKVLPARTVIARRTENEHMVRIQVRKLGTTNSVIIDYNFRDPVEGNKLYKSVIDSGAPETILPYNVRSILGNKGWNPHRFRATGYGSPSLVFVATETFEVAIGDNDTWSKWVRTNTLRVWQRKPGNHIDSSLVGCDVLNQFFFVHQPDQGYKFLRATDEDPLTNFINGLI